VIKARVDDNLKPAGTTREVTGAGAADFTLMTVYSSGKLSIEAKTAQGSKATTIDVPADSWDNDQSALYHPCLALDRELHDNVHHCCRRNAGVAKTQLAVLGKEQVAVPAGSFSTYKVQMSVDQQKIYAWYDAAIPHHLIKVRDPTSKTTAAMSRRQLC